MARTSMPGLLLFLSHLGFILGQEEMTCSPVEAETCLTQRATQYHGVRSEYTENSAETDALRVLCLSQVRPDAVGTCFDQNTKSCTSGEDVQLLLDQWDSINKNITDMCLKECPSMFEISKCKDTTDTRQLKYGLFEVFCSTFNLSLRCVKDLISSCKLGPRFYADLMGINIMQYWQYICNSGCHNIDETVTVIGKCADFLDALTTKESICLGHSQFKTCVAEATGVCDEVMKIVRFKYRKYDIVEKACMTTIPTTTPSTTSTATPTTAITTETASTFSSSEHYEEEMPAAYECLDGVDTSQFEIKGQVHIEQILLILRLESCIHNISSDVSVLQKIQEGLGPKFSQLYHDVKRHGWSVLADSVAQCGTVREGSRGCSGHRYGLLQCNAARGTVGYPAFFLLTAAAVLFTSTA